MPSTPPYGLLGKLRFPFGKHLPDQIVTTLVGFPMSPEAVWRRLLTYEEVGIRPPLLLRTFLPQPVRSVGDKTRVGAGIHRIYSGGDLVKRITAVDPPRLLQFDVVKQRLGIEGCLVAVGGSCELIAAGSSCEIRLTAKYRSSLRPRFVWRPFERFFAHQLHRHILKGMRDAMPKPLPAAVELRTDNG